MVVWVIFGFSATKKYLDPNMARKTANGVTHVGYLCSVPDSGPFEPTDLDAFASGRPGIGR